MYAKYFKLESLALKLQTRTTCLKIFNLALYFALSWETQDISVATYTVYI